MFNSNNKSSESCVILRINRTNVGDLEKQIETSTFAIIQTCIFIKSCASHVGGTIFYDDSQYRL